MNEFRYHFTQHQEEQRFSMEMLLYMRDYLAREIVEKHPEGGKLKAKIDETEAQVRGEVANQIEAMRAAMIKLLEAYIAFIEVAGETKSIGELLKEAATK